MLCLNLSASLSPLTERQIADIGAGRVRVEECLRFLIGRHGDPGKGPRFCIGTTHDPVLDGADLSDRQTLINTAV